MLNWTLVKKTFPPKYVPLQTNISEQPQNCAALGSIPCPAVILAASFAPISLSPVTKTILLVPVLRVIHVVREAVD